MADIDGLFLELIQVAIGARDCLSRVLAEPEWGKLYAIAEKQTLTGICFAGIEKLPKEQLPDMDWLMEWLGQSEYIKTRNEDVNQKCAHLQKYFKEAGFRSCILKGQWAARYYGELASLRQSGDIDIWLEGGRKKILEFVQKTYPTKEVIRQHVHFHIYEDTEIEVHFSPSELMSPLHNWRLQKWFREQEKTELSFVEEGFKGPSMKFDAVFMLSHIYKHLLAEGIGLRQVLDYFFLLKTAKFSDEEKAEIMRLLDWFGMKRFASGVMWILGERLKLRGERLLCEPNEKEGRLLLDEMMKSGNFGHGDERRGKAKNRIGRLLETRRRTWKLAKSHPLEYLFAPVNRARQRVWMMVHGYTAKE